MDNRANESSSTDQAFVDECRHLKSMFHHLGYPSSLVNCIIDKCDYSLTLDAKTESVETLRVSVPFKDKMLYIRTIRPNSNTQSDITAKLFV